MQTFAMRHDSCYAQMWGAVAQWLESRALNRENPGSNPLAAVSNLRQLRPSHVATVHSAV